MSKAVPLENPPETSDPGDQPNGVAATQEVTKQTEEIGSVATPVSQQEATADQAVASADLPVHEESVPCAETTIASSEGPLVDKSPAKEAQSQEAVVTEEASKEVEQIPVEAKASRDEPGAVAENIPQDPKPCAPEDVCVNGKDEKAKAVVEDQGVLCLEAAQDVVLPGDTNVDVATQNENPDKEEPVKLLSKAIQSKGTSKCEGPPLSTRHLSGWFIHCEKQVLSNSLHVPIF